MRGHIFYGWIKNELKVQGNNGNQRVKLSLKVPTGKDKDGNYRKQYADCWLNGDAVLQLDQVNREKLVEVQGSFRLETYISKKENGAVKPKIIINAYRIDEVEDQDLDDRENEEQEVKEKEVVKSK